MSEETYNYVEAFCLMQYVDKVTDEIEILWNSRDGAAPFGIKSKRGNDAFHENWSRDVRAPNFKPAPGMRMFVAAPRENMVPILHTYIDKWWDDTACPMKEIFVSKEEVFEKLMGSSLELSCIPLIVEIV